MKSPLPLTAAVLLKEAAKCIQDTRAICKRLGESDAEQELGRHVAELEPIAQAMHERAMAGDEGAHQE